MKKILCLLLFTLLMGVPSMYHYDGLHFVLTAMVHALSYSILFLYITYKYKIAKTIVFTFLYILFFIETFTFLYFGSRLDSNIMMLILQTDLHEIKGFFSLYVFSVKTLIFIVIFIVLYYLSLKHIVLSVFSMWLRDKKLNYYIILIAFLEIVLSALPLQLPKGDITLEEVYKSLKFVRGNKQEVYKIEDMIGSIDVFNSPSKNEGLDIVLVIGESFNRLHSNLYGYKLNTTPHLASESNLIVFNNAMSPSIATYMSMRFLFSLKSCDNENDSCQFVLMPTIFKKAQYKVGYFDNQYTRTEGGYFDAGCNYFLNTKIISMNSFDYRNDKTFEYDGDFINHYKSLFYYENKSLNIIHLKGQHLPAKKCYPKSFERFTSSEIQRENLDERQKEVVAEYDNATLYNDFVIHQIINCFRQKDAIVFYLSDHGENIFDGKTHTIGRLSPNSTEEETKDNINRIPFVVWCSDTFIAKHPEKYESLKSSSNKMFCSDDIPYLLLDIASIDSNYNNESRSLINKKYIPHHTIMQ